MNLTSDLVRIVQDDDVQRLAAMLDRFNPFDVLRIGHYELRHTNTLAWLLDPAGNHGLGEFFLRAVVHRLDAQQNGVTLASCFEVAADRAVTVRREVALSKLRANAPEAERLGLDDQQEPVETLEDQQEPEETRAKHGRARGNNGAIDILLEGDGWVLAIEAKVRSVEANEQLQRYREGLEAYVRGDTSGKQCACFYVFLTVDGDKPSDPAWQVATWLEHVVNPLEAMLTIRQDLQPEVHKFLESYQETLRHHAGDGGAAETLAATTAQRFQSELRRVQTALKAAPGEEGLDPIFERVARRHAPLLRLLLNQLVSPQAARAEEARKLMQERGFEPLRGSVSYMRFVPKDWRKTFHAMLEDDRKPSVTFEFVNRAPAIIVKLIVPALGPNALDAQSKARRKLVRLIHERGQKEGLVEPFRAAFYVQRAGEPLRPRVPTEHYYSVYTRSGSLDDDHAPGSANRFVSGCLDEIKRDVLPVLIPLMREAGLN